MELSRNHQTAATLITTMVLMLAAVASAVTDEPTSSPSYFFTTLDVPTSNGELGRTSITDINERGDVVGSPNFLLERGRTRTKVECPGAVSEATPTSINRHGAITGSCSQGGSVVGFFRRANGTVILLNFPGATETNPRGINDFNQIVGNYRDRALGLFHGFLWDSGVFLTIDFPFPSATDNGAEGINNAGQIVGTYVDDDIDIGFLNGHPHGYLYANGAFSTVDFPGAIASWLADINDNGTVVGTYATDDPTFGGNFVFDQGVFVAFALPFPNLIVTHVQGINNRGQLVGQYMEHAPSNPPGEQFFRRGFIATQQP